MPPRPLSETKRQAILDAAIEHFSSHGFAATRIADIAVQAGIGKGTVYEYFPSKEELLLDACLYACRRNENRMDAIADGVTIRTSESSSTPSFEADSETHPVRVAYEVLRSVISVLLDKSRTESRMFHELFFACAEQENLMQQAREEFGKKFTQWLESAFALGKAGMEAGYFHHINDKDYRWCARLIVATVDGLIVQRAWLNEQTSDETASHIAAAWIRLHLKEPQRLEEFLQ